MQLQPSLITASAFIGVTSEFFQIVTSTGFEPLYNPAVNLIKNNPAFKNFVYSGSDFTATFAWTAWGGVMAIGMKQLTDKKISEYYSNLCQKTSDPSVLESYRNHEEMYKTLFGFTEYSAASILTLIMSSTWILDELSQALSASHRFNLEKHTFQTEDLTAYIAGIALGHLFFAGSLAYMYIKNHMK